jgi:hypothetical protein
LRFGPDKLGPRCGRALYRLRLGGLVIANQRHASPEVLALAGS